MVRNGSLSIEGRGAGSESLDGGEEVGYSWTGHTSFKHTLLTEMGWRVVHISPMEWKSLPDRPHQIMFLHSHVISLL